MEVLQVVWAVILRYEDYYWVSLKWLHVSWSVRTLSGFGSPFWLKHVVFLLWSFKPCQIFSQMFPVKNPVTFRRSGQKYFPTKATCTSSAIEAPPPLLCSQKGASRGPHESVAPKVKFRAKCVGLSFKRVDVMLLPAVWEKDSQILLN